MQKKREKKKLVIRIRPLIMSVAERKALSVLGNHQCYPHGPCDRQGRSYSCQSASVMDEGTLVVKQEKKSLKKGGEKL